jgi:hypothetical protein
VLKLARGVGDTACTVRENRKLNVEWPPLERMPSHIQDALHAGELHDRGEGPALNDEQVEALMDLTSWAFNGVAKDHPQFEVRLAAWTAQVLEHHGRRAA